MREAVSKRQDQVGGFGALQPPATNEHCKQQWRSPVSNTSNSFKRAF
jgi:hypothetical protein